MIKISYVKINELLNNNIISTITPSLKLKNEDLYDKGINPVVSQDKQFIIGYTDLKDDKLVNAPYIIFGDHTEIIKYIDFPFVQGADGIKILKVNSDKLDSRYLYYALKSCYYPTGFYERHFKLLKKTYMPDFNYDYQIKIAKILGNYDNLIENNNRRIKLLETMAEELYKEWFVRFRFPGTKKEIKHKIVSKGYVYGNNINGLNAPKSWNYKKLNSMGEFVRGRNITQEEMQEGNIEVISAGIEPSGFHNEYNVNGQSLTISASGANAGYLSYHLDNIWAADCSYYSGNYIWFIYHSLHFIKSVINNLKVGSAQPHVYAKNVNNLFIIVPDINTINEFENRVKNIYSLIRVLKSKNNVLIKQRDYLLSRLMSGKLSVENTNII